MQGRALDPPGIRRELNRWQRQLATDADGWLGATAGVTEDGWSVVVMYFDSEQQARRNSDRPERRAWWREASRHLGEVAFHDAAQVRLFGDAARTLPAMYRSSRATSTTWSAWPASEATRRSWPGKRPTSWG
jgi:hypothetical protein